MKQWVFASMTAIALGLAVAHPAVRAASSDKGTIEGRVFEDKDGDGIRDAGEKGLEGVKVKLAGKLKRTAETDKNGKFSFEDLADGNYDVSVVLEKDWVAVKDFTDYKDLEVSGATLSDVDFALQDKQDAEAAAKDEATATAEPAATEVPATEAAVKATDEDLAASTSDATATATDDADAEDSEDEDAATTTAADAGDDEDEDTSEPSMEDAAAKLVAGLAGSDLDPEVVAALQKALADAQAAGDQSDVTKVMETALATLPKDVREQASAAATEVAAKDTMARDDKDDDEKDDKGMSKAGVPGAPPAASPRPAHGMPETGGGTLALGALLAAGLAALGGAGRLMERRRS